MIMTQEQKELLLKDLCARLPYYLFVEYKGESYNVLGIAHGRLILCKPFMSNTLNDYPLIKDIKPYPFPLSSMTEEQKKEYYNLCIEEEREEIEFGEWITRVYYHNTIESIDWLNKHHFDYRSLIQLGLALDATNLNIYC